MSDNRVFLNAFDLEDQLKKMKNRDLLEFVARQVYDARILAEKHNQRITSLEKQSRKISGIIGAIGTFVGAAVVSAINYLLGK